MLRKSNTPFGKTENWSHEEKAYMTFLLQKSRAVAGKSGGVRKVFVGILKWQGGGEAIVIL